MKRATVNRRTMFVAVALLLARVLFAEVRPPTPVGLTLDPNGAGTAISSNFVGLSYTMSALLPDAMRYVKLPPAARDLQPPPAVRNYFFSTQNKALVGMFRALGIRNLRVGGNTADLSTVPVPTRADIDSLFAFAKETGVQVIYTLRMEGGSPQADAEIARYVMERYRSNLMCFAIGNEPNHYFREYPAFRDAWEKLAAAITSPGEVPAAKFCGPGFTPSKRAWVRNFVKDFGNNRSLALITQHAYPGGGGYYVTNAAAARDRLLSPELVESYGKLYESFATAAISNGLPYRLEETSSFSMGGAKDVSDTFTSALWALDYMFWWAAHGVNGVNFMTGGYAPGGQPKEPMPYAVFWNAQDGYAPRPMAYALKAFDLGSHGRLSPVRLANDDNLNLTAYGVVAGDGSIYLTVINKEHGSGARQAKVTINAGKFSSSGQVIFLVAPGGDVSATSGLTLGDASIQDDGSWNGTWKDLAPPSGAAEFKLTLPAATAAVVKLLAK